ncbi:MAG TPA: DUF397 domain-containing protein [Mycobacteriales bacterium]|nr:DUF397 domain-containing protein [Mycobacteriales bacterium]
MREQTSVPGGQPTWRKSSYSGGNGGQCVEVADLDGTVGIRDSKNPGPALTVLPAAWAAFLDSVRNGQFDR